MIRQRLKLLLEEALVDCLRGARLELADGSAAADVVTPVIIERPRGEGDLACGVALKLAARLNMPAFAVAEIIAASIAKPSQGLERITVSSSGYISFCVGADWLIELLIEIHRAGDSFGRAEPGHQLLKVSGPGKTVVASLQYAHARLSAMVRVACRESFSPFARKPEPPMVDPEAWQAALRQYRHSRKSYLPAFDPRLNPDERILQAQKNLIIVLDDLPNQAKKAVLAGTSRQLMSYASLLIADLETLCCVISTKTGSAALTLARLGLILAVKQVLKNTLGIIGVPALEEL